MENRRLQIQNNLTEINEKISKACLKVGRKDSEVKTIAVSKFFPSTDILIANNLGLTNFGESRVQEFSNKFEEIGDKVTWHQIGHLQANKVKYIIDKVNLIHSVCSIELLEEVEKYAKKNNVISNILLQVNISGEESKFGVSPEKIELFLEKVSGYKNIKIKGLMAMAPLTENQKEVRQVFAALRKLFENIKDKTILNVDMQELSMGMSNDYEIAIQEGATMVRIGTAIFGKRI